MGHQHLPMTQTRNFLRSVELVLQFNMISLQTLRAGDFFKIDFVSGLEYTVTFSLNGRVVNKHFFAALRFDKSVAFFGRKPLDYACVRMLNDVVDD